MNLTRWPSSGVEASLNTGHTSISCYPNLVRINFSGATGLKGYGYRSSNYRVEISKHELIDLVHKFGLFLKLAEHANEVIITRIGHTNLWLRTELDDYGSIVTCGWIEPPKALEYKPVHEETV